MAVPADRDAPPPPSTAAASEDQRAPYEPPGLLKKRSVTRVTQFHGTGGVSGLTVSS